MARTGRGLKLSLGFSKVPYLDHYYVTYFYVTYSKFSLIYILATTKTIALPTQLTSYCNSLKKVNKSVQMAHKKPSTCKP